MSKAKCCALFKVVTYWFKFFQNVCCLSVNLTEVLFWTCSLVCNKPSTAVSSAKPLVRLSLLFTGLIEFFLHVCVRCFYHIFSLRPYKNFLFPVPAHITFGKRINLFFISYFIEFDVFDTTINYFSVKADPFCLLL